MLEKILGSGFHRLKGVVSHHESKKDAACLKERVSANVLVAGNAHEEEGYNEKRYVAT